jgi:hypothetical protein
VKRDASYSPPLPIDRVMAAMFWSDRFLTPQYLTVQPYGDVLAVLTGLPAMVSPSAVRT